MLRNAEELEGYAVGATDGVLGHVKDLYLDDEKWVVRYLVVETGSWLSSRKVLVSPIAVGTANREKRLLPVSLSRDQVRKSPDIDTERPVSRQHEMTYSGYYAYPYYWTGAEYWGSTMYPTLMMPAFEEVDGATTPLGEGQREWERHEAAQHEHDDPHLRSCNAIIGYHIHASDGEIGHVAGLLLDEQTWAVRYLIIDTSNWWVGHKVLIAPQWIEAVTWFDKTVVVSVTRQAVKDAPAYDEKVPVSRNAEDRLYKHYGQNGYWTGYPNDKDEDASR